MPTKQRRIWSVSQPLGVNPLGSSLSLLLDIFAQGTGGLVPAFHGSKPSTDSILVGNLPFISSYPFLHLLAKLSSSPSPSQNISLNFDTRGICPIKKAATSALPSDSYFPSQQWSFSLYLPPSPSPIWCSRVFYPLPCSACMDRLDMWIFASGGMPLGSGMPRFGLANCACCRL